MNQPMTELVTIPSTPSELLFNTTAFNRMSELSKMMSGGKTTIPVHLQGNPADCMAIIMQAAQWRFNPFAVAQKTHLVNGVLGYEAQLINAVITSLAPIEGRPEYEFFGKWDGVIGNFKMGTSAKGHAYATPAWTPADEKGLGVVIRATFIGESKPRELTLLLSQCWPRNSTNWSYDPQQQICYVAIKKWARRYCPDVIMGVYSNDELEPAPQEMDITTRASRVDDDLPANEDFEPVAKSKAKAAPKAEPKPEPVAEQKQEAKPAEKPVEEDDGEGPRITKGQITIIQRTLENNGVSDTAILAKFGVNELSEIPLSGINVALDIARGK